MICIKLRDVVKRYDTVLAVDNINLSINKGEIFGLLGPNGAGKSTTIKMIIGLLKQNSGDITVNGMDVRKDPLKVKKIMGYVPQELAIYESLSAVENIKYFGRLYGLGNKELNNRTEEALEFTGLINHRKQKTKSFSGGMKRRLNIACSIVHQPEIIIMDEPTVGIDPQSRNHILESVKKLNERGSTIIYTSHYMEEVENICDRVGIIDQGKLIACGTKNELKNQTPGEEKIIINTSELRFNPIDEIKKITGVTNVGINENTIEILSVNAQQILQDVLFVLYKGDVPVRNISLEQADLESVFLSLTGRNLRD